MEQAEENGKLEASDYEDKAKLLSDLTTFKPEDKALIVNNLKAGKGAFD